MAAIRAGDLGIGLSLATVSVTVSLPSPLRSSFCRSQVQWKTAQLIAPQCQRLANDGLGTELSGQKFSMNSPSMLTPHQ